MIKSLVFAVLSASALAETLEPGVLQYEHKERYVYVPPQNISRGCGRFYISNPITSGATGTKYWEVCAKPETDRGFRLEVGEGVWKKIKDRYGAESANSISYVTTGPDCWVDLFTEHNLKGRAYEITPLRDVDLSLLKNVANPLEHTFNDNILSATVRSTLSTNEDPDTIDTPPGIIPVAVYYRINNMPKQQADNGCAYLYDADPNTTPELSAMVVCVSQNQHLAHLSVKDLMKRSLILSNHVTYQMTEKGPWTGDENFKYYYNSRGLRGMPYSAYTISFFGSLADDLAGFWESIVETVDTILTDVVAIFTGASLEPTPAPARRNYTDLTGIAYVVAPPDADVALFTEDDFLGEQTLVTAGSEMPIGSGSVVPVVNSFFVVSKKYSKTIVPTATKAARMMAVKKYAEQFRDHTQNPNYAFDLYEEKTPVETN